MDKKITVRFYQVRRRTDGELPFSECIDQIRLNHVGVWIDIDDEITVRLERCQNPDGFFKGEFSRKQTENIPPKAQGDNEDLIVNSDHLAHRMAFQYHPQTSVIAVEVNRNGMSIGRVNDYLKTVFSGHSGFDFLPVVTEQAWNRFDGCEARKILIGVANPEDLSVVEGHPQRMRQNLIDMKQLMGGSVVEASVGFGRQREGLLSKGSVASLIRWLSSQDQGDARVTRLQVKGEGEEEIIDFLTEQLKASTTLSLNDNNINSHYTERKTFIERTFNSYLAMLRRTYGAAA